MNSEAKNFSTSAFQYGFPLAPTSPIMEWKISEFTLVVVRCNDSIIKYLSPFLTYCFRSCDQSFCMQSHPAYILNKNILQRLMINCDAFWINLTNNFLNAVVSSWLVVFIPIITFLDFWTLEQILLQFSATYGLFIQWLIYRWTCILAGIPVNR
jgi:hypothetical protein